MGITKMSIGNSSYIGAYAFATDSYVILTSHSTHTEREIIADALGAGVFSATINGSGLLGVYAVGNSRGLLLPEMADQSEIHRIRKELGGVEVSVLCTDLNALRNNILVNDKIAFVNPEFRKKEINEIEHALGVEVIARQIGGYATVGANNILTNKGMVITNSADESDVHFLNRIVHCTSQTTANLGSPSIGLCTIANSNGVVVGAQTTGFELTRVTEGLDMA
ncbi:MAG: translation initiation factor IF-6 [Candidatus Marsarchaeota archaeon]|nr:translation initiation factor IF-6 [Candidatus Marsarchaeota archaeon]MCL5413188.1 translation initiation factor IF-6 [Candidatus Marsarchaeota archaeon]